MRRLLLILALTVSQAVLAEDAQFDYGDGGISPTATIYQSPLRSYSIIASQDGYYPDKLVAFEGEKVKFFVTGTDKIPNCFIIQQKGLFLAANLGTITEGEVFFDKAGEYEFHCPTNNIRGKLTILSRDSLKPKVEEKKESKRGIASETEWTPKD